MKPVRILHIVHTLNRGGMESRIMDLYRNINHDKYQYDFYVESGKSGIFDDEVKRLGGRVYQSKGIRRYNIPDFKAFHQFITIHPEYKIVYAYNQWAGFYLKEAKKCGVPYRIANARTSIQTKSLRNIVKNLVKLNVNRYSTHRFAVSKKAANWLFGKKLVDAGDIKIWPNAIDTQKFIFSEMVRNEVRNELGLGTAFTVIHVGNIRFEKNHLFLLQIFAEVKKKYSDAKLILIGGGDIEMLKPQITKLRIDNSVMYLGIRQDIPRLLQAGDVFVFPSLYEGFPGAVLEAEASGLNCLISDSITDEVILTDHIAALSLNDNPQKWACAIESFNKIDRKNAWKTIKNENFDIKDLVIRTEKFFDGFV